ncbi:pentatricopeptide repeat-containing protein At3g14580, mitochondrial-like [Vicia villosa]|uniref:pentatricopeptide repeat-containing protein At3g14580, mitochondrial-like n=1 Tax=Vicia villosa TaxID=3911 RepID=UPI00273AA3BD|nr:pentatricopeptide repeat-containing protein At3g14580, mitochondrial-like [Vicia villosa]
MFSRTRSLLPSLTSNKTPNSSSSLFSSSSSQPPNTNTSNKDNIIVSRFHHKDWLTSKQATTLINSLTNPSTSLTLFNLYSSRKDYNPTQPFCISLITKLAQSHQFSIIDSLLKSLQPHQKHRFTQDFFFHLIKLYAHKANRIDKVLETLFMMPSFSSYPTSKTFNFVLNLLVNNKLHDVVFNLYSSASKLGFEIDACCLNIIIKGLCKQGEMKAAFKVFDEFPKLGIQRNERTFCTLIHGLCEKGDVDEAFELLEVMKREKVCVDVMVYNVLICGLRRKGRVDEAKEVLEDGMMRNGCYPNESSYQHVLYGLIDMKRFGEAKEVVKKMVLKGFVPSFDSFKGLVFEFCKEGLVGEVEWGVRGMVRMGFIPRMGMWRQIVKCVVVCRDVGGSFDKILDVDCN